MKLLIICLSIAFVSCSSSQNETMARLLTKQKTLKDSIDYYHNAESYYKGKARDAMRGDTTKVQSLIDSMNMSYNCGRADEAQLKTAEFSIDSLSKMK